MRFSIPGGPAQPHPLDSRSLLAADGTTALFQRSLAVTLETPGVTGSDGAPAEFADFFCEVATAPRIVPDPVATIIRDAATTQRVSAALLDLGDVPVGCPDCLLEHPHAGAMRPQSIAPYHLSGTYCAKHLPAHRRATPSVSAVWQAQQGQAPEKGDDQWS